VGKHVGRNILIAVVIGIAVVAGVAVWYSSYRVVPQPAWISADARDKYLYGSTGGGSTGGNHAEGLPYWIWLAMPRMFPEYMPGPGGYAALGLSWEEGREMPVGFTKQKIGYVRVTGNCALCHAVSYPTGPDEAPRIVAAVPGHATDVQPLMTFLRRCAQDPRFNADEIFSEVDTATKLSLFERLRYRFILIPRTREALMKDPASVIFDSDLRLHGSDPGSDAPFSSQRMKELRDQMKAQETTAQAYEAGNSREK
jgi:hypothetical protein